MRSEARPTGGNRSENGVNTRRLRAFAWVLLIWLTDSCFGQVITVRIVNEKNGQPLAGQEISVSFFYRTGESVPQAEDSNLHLKKDSNLNFHLKTDAHGLASFNLSQPAPAQLWVGAGLPSQYWFCACATRAFASTQEVIEKGITARVDSKRSKVPNAKPGQIIFVARPYNFFERLMYPLLKE
jgi:hypothetical protein